MRTNQESIPKLGTCVWRVPDSAYDSIECLDMESMVESKVNVRLEEEMHDKGKERLRETETHTKIRTKSGEWMHSSGLECESEMDESDSEIELELGPGPGPGPEPRLSLELGLGSRLEDHDSINGFDAENGCFYKSAVYFIVFCGVVATALSVAVLIIIH